MLIARRLIRALGGFHMRNLDTEAYGCLWLLSSVIVSILVPVALSEARVESRLAWYILAPGWRLSPFGHAEVLALLLAVFIDAVVYVAAAYGVLRLIARAAGRERAT